MNNYQISALLEIADQITNGEIPEFQHNECYTAGAYDLLLINVCGADAFDLMSDLCQRFSVIRKSGNRHLGFFLLLTTLAPKTNTTEMPDGLREIVMEFPGELKELRKWYRV